MYYVPEGTTRCGYYECESCGEKFLSLQTMEHISCPYCEAEFDPEIGPDEAMQVAEDTAKLIHEAGLKNVLVTNGTAELWVLKELSPYIDAMNIDLKGFSEEYYNKTLGGNLHTTLQFITEAVKTAHVELTTLIVPHCNDTEREMRELSSWVAGLDRDIPLHITRFFPRAEMTDRDATDVQLINRLVETAREKLRYVYKGNC